MRFDAVWAVEMAENSATTALVVSVVTACTILCEVGMRDSDAPSLSFIHSLAPRIVFWNALLVFKLRARRHKRSHVDGGGSLSILPLLWLLQLGTMESLPYTRPLPILLGRLL